MDDLDNDPTKLIEIVEIGKQLLMTRGTLTTFSIANDVAKYFAIVPALFMVTIPALAPMNIMHLHSPESAILSAIIFNASQLADLRFGRCNCPVHWYQVDRYDCKFIHVKVKSILKTFLPLYEDRRKVKKIKQ